MKISYLQKVQLRHVSKNMVYNKCQGGSFIKSRTIKFSFILMIFFIWRICHGYNL